MTYQKLILFLILVGSLFLRFYKLTQIPIAFHGDELGAGYNAYCLLKTGKDEYGLWWPLSFRENISPLNFYLMIPFVHMFGLTEIAVRLPGVIWGVLTVMVCYWLSFELFKNHKLSILACFFLAISPWHIQVSRIAHDANLGLLIQLLALLTFIKSFKAPRLFKLAFALWGLSIYSYHGPKVSTPLLLLGLLFIYRKSLKKHKQELIYSGLIFLAVVLPFVYEFLTTPLSQNRLLGVSILVRDITLNPVLSQASANKLWAILLYNPLVIYAWAFLKQYFQYLNSDWLFFDSSLVRYFNVSRIGLLYIWHLPFFIYGLVNLRNLKKPEFKIPYLWLLIAPAAGALTLGYPNGGRGIMFLPMFQIVSAYGVIKVLGNISKYKSVYLAKFMVVALASLLIFNVLLFINQYFLVAPKEFYQRWSYGTKEAVQLALSNEDRYDLIIFTDKYKQPYIYYLFYGKKDPNWLQQTSKHRRKSLGYDVIGKYNFRPLSWEADSQIENALLIGSDEEIPQGAEGIIGEIKASDGKVVYRIVSTNL